MSQRGANGTLPSIMVGLEKERPTETLGGKLFLVKGGIARRWGVD